jgi:hypothetical protein
MFSSQSVDGVSVEYVARELERRKANGWTSVQPHAAGFAIYGNANLEELDVLRQVVEPLAVPHTLTVHFADQLGMGL